MSTIEELLEDIRRYNACEEKHIKRAYELAEKQHKGQIRKSGEPYIVHPLSVAGILSELEADKDTVCAGLLHDVVEDTDITVEELEELFNKDVASLVEAVTKISKLKFPSKQVESYANIKKLILSMSKDIRAIIIKLADRLHNMRTLQYKGKEDQKRISLETLEIYVPIAYYCGMYKIKSELEDLALKYLKPDVYSSIEEKRIKLIEDNNECKVEMLNKLKSALDDKNIPNELNFRVKNIYGIYKKLSQGYKISDVHDLLAIKIMVDEIDNCYRTLGVVHSNYHQINSRFKDYIGNPKTNMYQALHTTLNGLDGRLVQTQIMTFNMARINNYGLTAYWHINKGGARKRMQEDLATKLPFFRSLKEIDSMLVGDEEFVTQIKRELFGEMIHVHTPMGDVIELPLGATVIDFAYAIHTDIGNTMVEAIVNDKRVQVDYVLENKDRVTVITDNSSFGPRLEWSDKAHTTRAKTKIKELNNKFMQL